VNSYTVEPESAGLRLDHYLAARLPQFSRSRIQSWIEEGRAHVDGEVRRASWKLLAGERVEVEPAELKPLRAEAEDIPLDVLYEDDDVIAINKPAGMVVHAGAGRIDGTLVNALLHRFGALSGVGGDLRPGIVHRLDKGTSGVILVARSDAAHRALAAQFAARTVRKTYLALVEGIVKSDNGFVDQPITRDPTRRTRMTARLSRGRAAHTEFTVRERYTRSTLLEVRIGTGRTHQIRVHMSSLGHAVVGDTLYGAAARAELDRPWLHAWRVEFTSPSTGKKIALEAPLPEELTRYAAGLEPLPMSKLSPR
jgi:23S rRNA pseudouridine1911/1915/1917 synthase